MNRIVVFSFAAAFGAEVLGYELLSGWKLGVCANAPRAPDATHTFYLAYGRGSYCYVSEGIIHSLHLEIGILAVSAVVMLSLVSAVAAWLKYSR